MLVCCARSRIGEFLLILLCVARAVMPNVDASPRRSICSQISEQERTHSSEAAALIEAAFKLYESGHLDQALADATKAKKLNKNDFRPYAIAGLVLLAERKPENASKEFASLAQEMDEYRKTYEGRLIASPLKPNQ
jgi:tetratricopeptide (TPR) repeat protein